MLSNPINQEYLETLCNLDEDVMSTISYGSHKHRPFKDESHKGSANTLDDEEEKRDASKEELGIEDGKK